MTNDEAIYVLKNTAWLGWDKQKEKVTEAVQMAVEALKTQLPKEDTTSDCVSRQEAIRIASGYCHPANVAKELAKLPSVQPEPCEDAVSRKAVEEMLKNGFPARGMWEIEGDVVKQTVCETLADALMDLGKLPSVQSDVPDTNVGDLISRQAAIGICKARLYECAMNNIGYECKADEVFRDIAEHRIGIWLEELPSVQPEIIRCKDCEYGKQDEVGRWFCQIGNEDGSGFCADAERRTDGSD